MTLSLRSYWRRRNSLTSSRYECSTEVFDELAELADANLSDSTFLGAAIPMESLARYYRWRNVSRASVCMDQGGMARSVLQPWIRTALNSSDSSVMERAACA